MATEWDYSPVVATYSEPTLHHSCELDPEK